MNQELYEKLREMRLPIMAEEYKDQSENPSIQNMTFEERFESMVIKEYDSRINHTVERYIKNARFYDSNANLQDINYKPDREISRSLIEELSTNEYIQQKLNIILIGASGSGKTWISNAFGINACMERYRVQYTRLLICFRKLKKLRFKVVTKNT